MLSLLFAICMIWIFGKLFFFGLKATWGITKFLVTIVLLPLVLIIMAVSGRSCRWDDWRSVNDIRLARKN